MQHVILTALLPLMTIVGEPTQGGLTPGCWNADTARQYLDDFRYRRRKPPDAAPFREDKQLMFYTSPLMPHALAVRDNGATVCFEERFLWRGWSFCDAAHAAIDQFKMMPSTALGVYYQACIQPHTPVP